jgi:hypothetical protein
MSDCPCENCICVAICRYKHFADMIRDCTIIMRLLYYDDEDTLDGVRSSTFNPVIEDMKKILNPTMWNAKVDSDGFLTITDELYHI